MSRRFKASSERYRTFGGDTYIGWLIYWTDDRVAAYRQAGVRFRRLKEELFIHEDDKDLALTIDHPSSDNAI